MDNIHALAGPYALDALDDLERVRFEGHLTACDTCAQEVQSFQDTAALLGEVEDAPISADFRAAVLENIDTVRQVGPVVRRATSVVPRLAPVAAAVLAVAVLGLSVVTAGLREENAGLRAQAEVAEIMAADDALMLTEAMAAGTLKIVASPAAGAGAIMASDMAAAPTGHAYQLWLITEDGEALPAGFLEVGEDGTGQYVMHGDMDGVAAIGVTVEPDGGSPAPTTEPVAVVPLAA